MVALWRLQEWRFGMSENAEKPKNIAAGPIRTASNPARWAVRDGEKQKSDALAGLIDVGDARYKAFAPFWRALTRGGCQMTEEATVPCLGCGQPMAPRAGLMVCSDACRQREWRRRRRRGRRQLCCSCGGVFTPGRRDQAFCCVACAARDYRRRKPPGKPPRDGHRRPRGWPRPRPGLRAPAERPRRVLAQLSGRGIDAPAR